MAAVATAAALHETLGVLVTATTSTSAPGDDEHVLNVYFSSVGNTWELACETRLRRTEHPNGVHSILFVREEEALGCGGPLLVTCGEGEGGGACVWKLALHRDKRVSLTLESIFEEWYATHLSFTQQENALAAASL